MSSEFRQTSAEDSAGIAALLGAVFELGADELAVRPDHMHWKYWEPRAAWPGSRSYVIDRAGSLQAHGAAWPFSMRYGDRRITGIKVIDWAADKRAVGAGVALMRQMSRLADITYGLGGTEGTLRILPALGFRPAREMRTYARPLRPLAQAVSHQYKNWKLPARVVRNWLWTRVPVPPRPRDWSSVEIGASQIPPAAAGAQSGVLPMERPAELFEYLSRCPVIQSKLFAVRDKGGMAGHFCLVFVPGVARIADAWIPSSRPADWAELYSLAIREAMRAPGACEIMTQSSLNCAWEGLEACGFRFTGKDTLMIYDPGNRLSGDVVPHFQLIDNDAVFLHSGRPFYAT